MLLTPSPVSLFSRYRLFLIFAVLALLSACGGDDSLDAAGPGARTVPQNVALTTGTRMNELNWRGVGGARGYTVYWATEPGVTPTSGTAIPTLQPYFEHRGLANDTTYYYVVTSDTSFGQSSPSAVVEGTPRAARPARPGDLALQAGNGRITLRWDAIPGATHYTLYWQDRAGVGTGENTGEGNGESTRIAQVVSPFVHPGLENGRDYFYRLVAENIHGTSEASAEHSAMPLAPPPSAPRITQAEVAAGQVTLHWQHVGAASQYVLFWSDSDPLDGEAGDDTASLIQVTSPYTHAPLQDGRTYYYRLQTRNGDAVSALSNRVQVTPPGETSVAEPGAVPAVPTGLTVSLENGQLSLDWPPVVGALGYNLYWLSGETGEVTTEVARLTQIQPPYTHIPLNNGTLYRYRLSALNDHGESALSTEVNGIPQVVIPGVPAGVQALADDGAILVRWNPVQGATGYTLTIDDDRILDAVHSPYRITGLSNATTYQIQLQAQNTQGLSEPSAPVSATPREPVPNTPGNLLARSGNASVLLQWTAAVPQNADDPAEVVTGYRVYTATRPGVRPDNGTLVDAIPTRYDDGRWQLHHTSLQNGQRYYYVVSAQNAGGEGGLSREVWARPRVPAPDVPVGLSATPGDDQIRIDFAPPDTVADGEAVTYNLYWSQALDDEGNEGRSPTEVISNVQPGYDFSDGTDTNGTTYFFQVSAVNNGDEGPLSDEVSTTPRLPVPGQAPQDTRTLADNSQITLDWSPVAQATGYVIYWATDPDIDPRTSNRLSGEAIQPGFVHDGLENGQSYFYRVAAVNTGGEGALSALLAAQPQEPPPASPTDFSLQPGDGQVVIDFTPIPGATAYRVFWHWDVEAPLTQWSSRTVLPGDILAGLSNGQTNVYRLQALNAGGESLLTEPVSATPQPKPPTPPTGLAVASGDGELSVHWHTRPGLQYTLYWSDDSEVAPIDSGNVLSDARPTYRHTGLSNDRLYRYQVSARNSGGESVPSEPVQATPAGVMPGIPQALSAESGQNQVTLSWLPPVNATGTPQYTLYWSTTPDQGTNGTALTAVSSPFVHTGLNNNQRYYYVITATTDSVEGSASAQVEALSTGGAVPAQPQGVQGSTGDGRNTLQWQAVADAGEYTVQWSTQVDMGGSQGTTVSAPPFVHNEPPASTLYYRVIAHNGNGDSLPSAIVEIVQDSPNQAPQITQGAVVNVILDEDDTLLLTFNATDNDGDTLTWSIATTANHGSAQVIGNNTSANVTYTPQAGVSDTFTVQVDDGRGGTDRIHVNVDIMVTGTFEITASTDGIKTIRFDWPAYSGATKYKLFVNPDGVSGFTLLQDNLLGTSTTIELPVHLTDWVNASYLLEVHHDTGKLTESSPVSITAAMINSIGYVKASNTEEDDHFGFAISLSADGNTLAVGAIDEASNATGIDGDQTDNSVLGSGAVYVFSRSGSTWIPQAYVKASTIGEWDWFGTAVSLSADGSTLAVGAIGESSNATGIDGDQTDNSVLGSGAVYVFSRSGRNWAQQAYVKTHETGASRHFGAAVSLSADGNTLAVEAMSATSTTLVPASGTVYVFSRSVSVWAQQAYINVSGAGWGRVTGAGAAVSLSADGNTLAVGAVLDNSNATNIDGDQADNSAPDSGAVYVFSRGDNTWDQQAYVKASNTGAGDWFGSAVSLSADGNTLAVGAMSEDSNATDSGAVYVFSRSVSVWAPQAFIKASNTGQFGEFGIAVSLSADGNILAVGASGEGSNATGIDGDQTDNSEFNSGAVYVFSRSDSTWAQQTYVKASNTGAHDRFGANVSLSADGNILAVGTWYEESNATDIDGDQTDNSAPESGAVYLY